MHSPSRLEASLRNSGGKLPRISYGAKSLLPTAFCKLHEPFYTLTVRPCTLTEYVLRSSCLSRMSSPKHNCYLSYSRCARSGCHSWLSFITVIQAHPMVYSFLPDHKLYENLTYTPHAARGYRIKLQCQEYTE